MKREKEIWKKEEERKNREIEAIKAINDLETKLHEISRKGGTKVVDIRVGT